MRSKKVYRGLAWRDHSALLVRAVTGNRAGRRLLTALVRSRNKFKRAIGEQAVSTIRAAIEATRAPESPTQA